MILKLKSRIINYNNTSGTYIEAEFRCDGKIDCLPDIGDDELNCTHKFGHICKANTQQRWVPPREMCLSSNFVEKENRYPICDDKSDQSPQTCNNTSLTCPGGYGYELNELRNVQDQQRCTVIDDRDKLICKNGADQVNCSNKKDIVLKCDINGKSSNISKWGVCTGESLCSNNIDEDCVLAEYKCYIHKHQLCDGFKDCKWGKDELKMECKGSEIECLRQFSIFNKTDGKRTLPWAWVCDGVEDCKDGWDENEDNFKVCHYKSNFNTEKRCVKKDENCPLLFRCPNDRKVIAEKQLCNTFEDCASEAAVCSKSREKVVLETQVQQTGDVKRLGRCIQGLSLPISSELDNYTCITASYAQNDAYGVNKTELYLEESKVNCDFVFGEYYVYLSCNGKCIGNVKCPLSKLQYDSCPYLSESTKLALVKESDNNSPYLTLALPGLNRTYKNEIFSCSNDECISFDKVCNLVDDCGDESDERSCKNHFQCKDGVYVAKSSKCDGKVDCNDFSDECNDACRKSEIINSLTLSILAWIMGICAIIFNLSVISKNILSLRKKKNITSRNIKTILVAIATGDLLVGGYLLCIGVVDLTKKDDYCVNKFKWLISNHCTALGVVSTMGSQMALFSMTVLSVYRCFIMSRLSPRGGGSNLKNNILLFLTILVITVGSAIIAFVPVLEVFEDYFINGLHYGENPLFTGAPDKIKHMQIIEAYYGRVRELEQSFSWKKFRILIEDMFVASRNEEDQDIKYQRIVQSESLGFYGNDGVCLFKYFVLGNDSQVNFVWSILTLNLLCFVVILSCYGYINISTISQTAIVNQNRRHTRAMQRKITAIIVTDFFCWVPFIVIASLHTFQVLNATPFYALFSIIVLPINSLINPLIYDTVIIDKIHDVYIYFRFKITGNTAIVGQ